MFWQVNGCNILKQEHAFNWSGSVTQEAPYANVTCGCGAFVMRAGSGRIVPSEELDRTMRYAHALGADDS